MFDSPPSIIVSGPYKGQGNIDGIIAMHQSNLKRFTHQNLTMTFSRFFKMVSLKRQTVCGVGAYKSAERENVLFYSGPSTIELPRALVLNKKNWQEIGSKNKASLSNILTTSDYRGMLIDKVVYAKEVLDVSAFFPDKIKTMAATEHQLFDMLIAGRIDFFLHQANRVNFLAKQKGFKDKVKTVQIDEAGNFLLGHTVCSKTDTGKKAIAKINQQNFDSTARKKYLTLLKKWHAKEDESLIEQIYKTDFFH